ncbi:Extracellular solute-binding protein family 1 [[Clostridium] ultunense Esp]|uniref:ABC transporter substrate-binding protein n=1 Tax=Thermicanus aegyptius TaxID=94009 RepID=UPI0002B70312|nr:ABC transporter substrate-binding protein [Thermicanus aegyptius]CCQ96496.1 Extracellular solute-binding protein family 1 [[Clostridium] ultunense Esp]
MKRKITLFLSLLLSFSLVLTACGGGSGNTQGDSSSTGNQGKNDSGEKNVTIQFWHTLTEEERVSVLKDLIAKFEAENPGIHVEQVPTAEEDFPSKISAALGANKLPAIIEGGIDQMMFLGKSEVLDESLHEEIINEIGKDDFFKGPLDNMKDPKGGYFGVPISGWVQGIWYNQELFKEKGLEPPTTWENILKAAKAFYDPQNQKYGIVIGTQKDDFSEQTFSQFALSNNAVVFDRDGKVNFNTPEMVEALTFYKELAQYTPPGAESWREAREMYLAGRVPMVMYSTYIMGDLSQNKELAKATGFAVPEKKSKASFGQISSLAVMNTITPEQREAAKKFVLFMMEKESNIKYLHLSPGGTNPVRKSIAEDPVYLDNEVLKTFGELASTIPFALDNLQRFGFQDGITYPQMGSISAQFIIGDAIYNMTEHGMEPKEAADKAQEAMEKVTQ